MAKGDDGAQRYDAMRSVKQSKVAAWGPDALQKERGVPVAKVVGWRAEDTAAVLGGNVGHGLIGHTPF